MPIGLAQAVSPEPAVSAEEAQYRLVRIPDHKTVMWGIEASFVTCAANPYFGIATIGGKKALHFRSEALPTHEPPSSTLILVGSLMAATFESSIRWNVEDVRTVPVVSKTRTPEGTFSYVIRLSGQQHFTLRACVDDVAPL